MHCDEIGTLLLRRLEGRLEPGEEQGLERHLGQCETCRETLEVQRRVAAVLAMRPVVEVPMGFARRVKVNLEPVPGWLDVLNLRVWTFRLAPVAAALLVVGAMGFGPTEAAEPLEFLDLVAEWVVDEDVEGLPAFSVFWQEEVTDDTLLEAVLTADSDEPL
jgi:anti-sigma factor RsiW